MNAKYSKKACTTQSGVMKSLAPVSSYTMQRCGSIDFKDLTIPLHRFRSNAAPLIKTDFILKLVTSISGGPGNTTHFLHNFAYRYIAINSKGNIVVLMRKTIMYVVGVVFRTLIVLHEKNH